MLCVTTSRHIYYNLTTRICGKGNHSELEDACVRLNLRTTLTALLSVETQLSTGCHEHKREHGHIKHQDVQRHSDTHTGLLKDFLRMS